jgi:hypothetical protein
LDASVVFQERVAHGQRSLFVNRHAEQRPVNEHGPMAKTVFGNLDAHFLAFVSFLNVVFMRVIYYADSVCSPTIEATA